MNDITKILLFGASGRMGQEVKNIASKYNCSIVDEATSLTNFSKIDASKIDLCIDFSSPAGLNRLLTFACEHHLPVISGTTGLTESDFAFLRKSSEKIKILHSNNFSIGIFALKKAIESVSAVLNSRFSIDIIERHHLTKVDAPSGTAKMLNSVLENLGLNANIHSLRSGDCKGEHSVIFGGIGESLTFSHSATDRSIFAHGAMSCVEKFLSIKQNGLYTLDDIFN